MTDEDKCDLGLDCDRPRERALQSCLEQMAKEGKTTQIRTLTILHKTKWWRPAQRRYNAQLKTDEWRSAMDELIKLAHKIFETPEHLRDSLFTAEELLEEI